MNITCTDPKLETQNYKVPDKSNPSQGPTSHHDSGFPQKGQLQKRVIEMDLVDSSYA